MENSSRPEFGNSIECWHFASANRRLGYGDGRLIVVGAVHEVAVTPKCCETGLHGSIRAIDALKYSSGPIISRVRISMEIDQQDDKLCGRRRKYLAVADATDELRSFSHWCALQVIHLWDAPDIVRQYLETGDESTRGAAWTAAWHAANAAAASAAAWHAAWTAASATAWPQYAASATAWHAASAAANAAKYEASISRDAAWYAQNAELDRRMRKLCKLED